MTDEEWRERAMANPGIAVYPDFNPAREQPRWVPMKQIKPWITSKKRFRWILRIKGKGTQTDRSRERALA